ncbi:MAG TPA: Gfo/Idh/MocA family oxidoreductase [Ferruginibacter sp.]|nr:Gfo/Idh/MocA family oxidoreductase [Ferruginibacter sp.]
MKINWGIIGCGDVTEKKSGPAFNKVNNSSLIAVMRRDKHKAKDYARRHHVPKWYDDADALIKDPEINAIYIATPPSTHEQYTLESISAGKNVYVEKPMTVNSVSALNMLQAAKSKNVKLVVAHYRREQPLFKKVKQLLDEKYIGEVISARIEYQRKPLTAEELAIPKTAWRVNSSISGGGLFHDIAPHQLDLVVWFFGEIERAEGISTNGSVNRDEKVTGNIFFKNGPKFNGHWCFNSAYEKDICEITGTEGIMSFPIFEHTEIKITKNNQAESLLFMPLEHVQQPMIQATVNFFMGNGPNPCSPEEGVKVMELIDLFTAK